jgi:hypothetical protein
MAGHDMPDFAGNHFWVRVVLAAFEAHLLHVLSIDLVL